jgi:hypothetical protein
MTGEYRLRLAAVALLGMLAAPIAQGADTVYPTGSRIGLVPPGSLSASDRFPGFEDKTTGASVLILDMAAQAYAEAAKQMSREALKQQGIVEEKRESFPSANGKGTLVSGRQEGERKARKWVLLTSMPDATALVVVEVPDDARDAYSEPAVRAMLASLAVRASVPIDEQLSLLPLRFDELSGMRPVRVVGTTGAILTTGPKDTLEASEQPLLIVSIGRGGPDDARARETFARNLFAGVGNLKDVRITGSEMLRLGGGLQTHQLFAEGKDPKTEAPIKLVQWIRFGSGAFLRVVGIARADEWPDAFPRFRAVRDGVNPRS